jgi:superfamily II DNA or RNA helicase
MSSFSGSGHKDVAHQIYRLSKISGLQSAFFAASGTILDASKEQFCSTCKQLGLSYAILDAHDMGRLFVAYGFICPKDGQKISAGRCRCGYSPHNRIPNVLQTEALRELIGTRATRNKSAVVVLPPGSGKTRIGAEDAKKSGAKAILYVAHTHEILSVAKSEFDAVFGSANVVTEKSALRQDIKPLVTIMTIQMVARNLQHLTPGSFDYLIIDEFHRAAASSYRNLIQRIRPAFLLGLTATPFRADRQNILELCGGNVVVNYELRTGIDLGVLCPYHYFGCFDDVDYSKIALRGQRYDVRDLEKALIIPERDQAIIHKWKERALDKPTLAFCCSIKHAKRVAASFSKHGISAKPYTSDLSLEKRHELLADFKNHKVTVLCGVDIFNEGADLPFVECLLFLRPTESQRIFYQQLGRGLRRCVGKSHCIIIDFIGNFKNAYKIVEYQGLLPEESLVGTLGSAQRRKDILNLPLGCEVQFDDRIVDIFARQALDPARATRLNIGRILMYQYDKLARKLGRRPKRIDIDRNCIVNSEIYNLLFGNWAAFERLMNEESSIST